MRLFTLIRPIIPIIPNLAVLLLLSGRLSQSELRLPNLNGSRRDYDNDYDYHDDDDDDPDDDDYEDEAGMGEMLMRERGETGAID